MKIKLIYIIIVLLFLIGLRVFHQIQAEIIAVHDEVYANIDSLLDIDTGIVCILIPQKTYYRIGEKPQIDILIINRTDSSIYLPGCLDGSADLTRLPYCDIKVLNRKIGTRKFLDVNPNPLVKGDLQILKPNDFFNPLNRYRLQIDTLPPDTLLGSKISISTSLENYWPSPILDGKNYLIPGRYEIQFVYSTVRDTIILHDWNINKGFQDFNLNILDSIPRIKIKSNIVTLKYRLF